MDKFLKNKQLNEEELREKKIILNSKPRFLMVALTNRCNLDCIMCRRICDNNKTFIPIDIIKKIYSILPFVEGINWQGGEVFLLDYFKELFIEIKKYKNIRQSIITNGLLIDQKWVELFSDAFVCLTFSIDAVTKDTYKKIRRGAKFQDLLKNLEILSCIKDSDNKYIELSINVVVMKSNYKELILFPDFCKKYGFKRLRFDYLVPGRPDLPDDEDIFFTKRDERIIHYLHYVIPVIEQDCRKLDIRFEYTFGPWLLEHNNEYPNNKTTSHEILVHNQIDYNFNLKCKIPWRTLFVDIAPFCDIRPHCICPHSVGNLREESIEDVWNSTGMQVYRKKLIDNNIYQWCSEQCIHNAVDRNHFEGHC